MGALLGASYALTLLAALLLHRTGGRAPGEKRQQLRGLRAALEATHGSRPTGRC